PVHDVQVSSAVAKKETLVRRLDHVFGIHLVSQSGADVPLSQADELVGEADKKLLGCGVVLALQTGQEFREGVRHGSRPAYFSFAGEWRSAAISFADFRSGSDLYGRDLAPGGPE